MALSIIFMGTPDFSVPTLRALHEAGHQIRAVYTQPPRPAGRRGLELTPSPVHRAAEELGLDVRHPTSLKGEAEQQAFAALDADVAVVVAYGLLLPQPILDAPRLGCFNGHASALPRWRGAAPIQRAIMAGDRETAMMVMKMEAGLDTGPVAMESRIPIDPEMTAGDLHDRLAEAGAALMVDAMAALETGTLSLTSQSDEGVTYAKKIDKGETRIDWAADAKAVHDRIRGLAPFPGAWCEMDLGGKRERVKVLKASLVSLDRLEDLTPGAVVAQPLTVACGQGTIALKRLQKAGGKPLDVADFVRGNPVSVGDRLQ
ncbi:methionyl-tRNA formyltransferase [Notoacmeibacter sp. MSK16QG-6]|uniref:methionyl-tRNA formyltransferase n=1 Tax=Notoacmeibacter sp. MSK16QG-6 TaxID=2957982 RepID=UPI00209D7BCA|nr:methionyl-tRNA formyltransferase [Notoacmeibacter sp. MSK16QG-6]MCP1198731.1 methionyl-tRNA formyltransferase [Notoacmeibacter sp. MSK16QG-6]